VRIIGGAWRSRVIRFPDLPGLRPSPDRVRETLFNWLGQDLSGLNCLDLFAGSGVLGFEAASRGAARVTLVDAHPRAVASLRANALALGGGNLEVVQADALQFCGAAGGPYDVVFLDPPFGQGWLPRIAAQVERIAAADASIYVEAEHELPGLGLWSAARHARAGQVHYHLMRTVQP
jgi:16S rRNA (guanine966-N2)-methyltransferase